MATKRKINSKIDSISYQNQDNKNDEEREIIILTLPMNAAYISAARLTSSSIANRLGFGIEEVEDIKTAVSEACTFVIDKFSQLTQKPFVLKFEPDKDNLSVFLEVEGMLDFERFKNETGILMMKALMTEVRVASTLSKFKMILRKEHSEFSV